MCCASEHRSTQALAGARLWGHDGEHLAKPPQRLGADAEGTEIEQGHIVTYKGAQFIVNGAAVAGSADEAMVDIIQLGKDITVPANQLTVFGELGG